MSHLHNIDGYSSVSAAEYQEYMQRMREVRQAEREQQVEKRNRARKFERPAGYRRGPEDEGESSGEPEGDAGDPQEDSQGQDNLPEPENLPGYIGKA
jgi:hypothetical protein